MRYLLGAILVVVGCGEVSPAGTGMGGSGGSGGTGGDAMTGGTSGAGNAGNSGTGGSTADAGSDAQPSCGIPIGQVNGIDTMATWKQSGSAATCADQSNQRIQIMNGAVVNYFNAGEWAVQSYTASPSTPGMCSIDLRYGFQDPTCGTEQLFVHLNVPAI